MKAMLTSISWQQYLLAIITIATAYYAVVLTAYFRTEALAILKSPRQSATTSSEPPEDIMGKVKEETLENSLSTEEIRFSDVAENDYSQNQ